MSGTHGHHDYVSQDQLLHHNEKKTFYVVILTTITMVVEITFGYLSQSMALLADGWHMASHAAALLIAFFAYRFAKSDSMHGKFNFGAGKLIPLGGYTSALLLGVIALIMIVESTARFLKPEEIHFNEAIGVTIIGLLVNVVSVLILGVKHEHDEGHNHGHEHSDHDHDHNAHDHSHDHNMSGAYMHVLADTGTSMLALVALICGKFWGLNWLDPAMGILGGAVILRWGIKLSKTTAWELLDGHATSVPLDAIRKMLEHEGAVVQDLHIWRIAPKANACEVILTSKKRRGADYYRNLIIDQFHLKHVVIEEHSET